MNKNILFKRLIMALCLSALVATMACEEEEAEPLEPTRLIVSADGEELWPNVVEVFVGDTITFYTSLYENEEYIWTVDPSFTFVENTNKFSVSVFFDQVGSGVIQVEALGINGTRTVSVVEKEEEEG
ncbi:hypothetical protein [Tunicatimonas pelagia]|uniref:hypothetical protein n=1 Tax=Tunicatimonas pelagia TaxID=931531 RepID=UPI0026659400|nr:hypothetical protein [Tunicatimonas pelagia]WKN45206.1 hypothetical protein P0M28_09570 [Tunicatimonas pelagia]